MKILFIAHRVPFPPNKGDKIRSFHILEYLHRTHDVHTAVPVDNEDDRAAVQELQSRGYSVISHDISTSSRYVNIIKSAFSAQPLSLGNFWSPQLAMKIKELAARERFDAVVVFSSSMADYATDLRIPIKIIDFCDLDSAKFDQYADFTSAPKSWIYKMESRRLAAFEKKLVDLFDYILLIGPEEKRLYDVNGKDDKVKIMSNGVALPATLNVNDGSDIKKPNIVFTGVMDYLPNIDAACWFVGTVWKRLRAAFPSLCFYIVGKNPVAAVKELHNPQNGVFVTGFVRDVAPYLLSSLAFVAPMRIARGMQTKILEAMSYGVPVVSSSGSARGIGATHKKELLVADTPEELEERITTLVQNQHYARQMRDSALNFINERFNWDRNLALFDELFAKEVDVVAHL